MSVNTKKLYEDLSKATKPFIGCALEWDGERCALGYLAHLNGSSALLPKVLTGIYGLSDGYLVPRSMSIIAQTNNHAAELDYSLSWKRNEAVLNLVKTWAHEDALVDDEAFETKKKEEAIESLISQPVEVLV